MILFFLFYMSCKCRDIYLCSTESYLVIFLSYFTCYCYLIFQKTWSFVRALWRLNVSLVRLSYQNPLFTVAWNKAAVSGRISLSDVEMTSCIWPTDGAPVAINVSKNFQIPSLTRPTLTVNHFYGCTLTWITLVCKVIM